MRENVSTIYISGPMRGIPEFNFPEFDRAKERLQGWGFDVISPADMDRADPIDLSRPGDMDKAVDRDVEAIRCLRPGLDKVCLLKGWENSKGAKAEAALAQWRGVECVLPEIWDREDGLRRMATVGTTLSDSLQREQKSWSEKDPQGWGPVYVEHAAKTYRDRVLAPDPVMPDVTPTLPLSEVPRSIGQADGAGEEFPHPADFGQAQIRTFSSGATRNLDEDKHDYEAFLSVRVLRRYAEYMHSHRQQADGALRDGDNWQKGIPFESYAKSGWRHFMDFWEAHREELEETLRANADTDPSLDDELASLWDGCGVSPEKMEEILCALLFNISGYLHELIKKRE